MNDCDLSDFAILEHIGEGSFGIVLRASRKATGEIVALKKIRLKRIEEGMPEALVRELKALQHLQHPNIVALYEVFAHGIGAVLVFEHMVSDLYEVLKVARTSIAECHVKSYLQMLLKGLAHCHQNRIMHRDLKPSNLLIGADGVLKIGDFGLARVFGDDASYSHQVATRWYRAPELLYGSRKYDQGVDLWAVGCIFAEMLNVSPLFPGENDIDQLYRVVKSMGTPTEQVWPGIKELPDFDKITFQELHAVPVDTLVPNASHRAVLLLKRFLLYPSSERASAREALLDPFFYHEPLPTHPRDLPLVPKVANRTMMTIMPQPHDVDEALTFPGTPPPSPPPEDLRHG